MSEQSYITTLEQRRVDINYGVKHSRLYYLFSAIIDVPNYPRNAVKDLFLELIGQQAKQIIREQNGMDMLYNSYTSKGCDHLHYEKQSGVVSRMVLRQDRTPIIVAPGHMDCVGVSIISENGVGHVHISPRTVHPEMIDLGEWSNIQLANTDFGAEIIKIVYGLAKNENWNLQRFEDHVYAAQDYFREHGQDIYNMAVVITGGNKSLVNYLHTAFKSGRSVLNRESIERLLPQMYVCDTTHPEWGNNPKTVVVSHDGVLLKNENSNAVIEIVNFT